MVCSAGSLLLRSGKAIKAYIAQQNTLGQKAIEADFEVFFSQAGQEKRAAWKEEARLAVNEVSSSCYLE